MPVLGAGALSNESIDDQVNALLVEGASITKTYDDTANTLTLAGVGPLLPAKTGRFYMTPISTATGTTTPTLSEMRLVPFLVPTTTTFDQALVEVTSGVASSVVRLGVYSDTSGQPSALVADWSTTATTSNGVKTISISQALTPGWYWLAVVAQTAAAQFRSIGAGATTPMMGFGANTDTAPVRAYAVASATGALPDPVGTLTEVASGTGVPRVLLRAA